MMTCMEDEILFQADYPDPADAPSDLDPDMSSTNPTLPIADLGTITIDDGSKDPASPLLTVLPCKPRLLNKTGPLFRPGLYSHEYGTMRQCSNVPIGDGKFPY